MESKREDENIDGLWRLRDSLYDLTDFISSHPGGAEWLLLTKGTDITEAVEVHHLHQDRLTVHLEKYFVRNASTPHDIKLRFDPNGFYVTLRNRVVEFLENTDTEPIVKKTKVSELL